MKNFTIFILFYVFAFWNNYAQEKTGFKVISSDQKSMILEYNNSYSINFYRGYIIPQCANSYLSNPKEIGSPIKLLASIPIALPKPIGNKIELINVVFDTIIKGKLAPVPILNSDNNGFFNESYNIEKLDYSKSLPTKLFSLNYTGISRNINCGCVNVNPVEYNISKNEVRFLKKIVLKISYSTSNSESKFVVTSKQNELLNNVFINSDIANSWKIENGINNELSKRNIINEAKIWLKIEVKESGLQKITAEDLKNSGIDLNSIDQDKIAIYNGGGDDLDEDIEHISKNTMNQIPTIIDKVNGVLSTIYFYGSNASIWKYPGLDSVPIHKISPFTSSNYFILSIGGAPTKEFLKVTNNSNPINFVDYGLSKFYYDDDKTNAISIAHSGSGRDWFAAIQMQTDNSRGSDSRIFTNQLDNLDRTKPVYIRAQVAHRAINSSCTFNFYENEKKIGSDVYFSGISDGDNETVVYKSSELMEFDANIIPFDNKSILKIQYNNSGIGTGYLDFYEYHFSKKLIANNGEISFTAPNIIGNTEFKVSNFSGSELIPIEITNPENPVLIEPISYNGNFIFRTSLDGKVSNSKSFCFTEKKNAKSVTSIKKIQFANLRGTSFDADVIVITSDELKPSVEKYVDYKNKLGKYKVALFTCEDIYNEFSFGRLDPTALRDFIGYAMQNWKVKPQYVLLAGDGTYDYRNISTKQNQFVPTYQTKDDYLTSTASSAHDDFFVRVVGNDKLIDLAISRIPVDNNNDFDIILDKIKNYEGKNNYGLWRNTVMLVSDDAWSERGFNGSESFVDQTESLWKQIPTWLEPKKIYLQDYNTEQVIGRRKPAATQDLLESFQKGAVIVNWNGHGNPNVWAHEKLLEKDQFIPQLTNDSTLSFVSAVTCNFGHFDDPNVLSGAEDFMNHKGGGAIALLATTRAVYISYNAGLMNNYFTTLFARDKSTKKFLNIGQAMFKAKQNITSVDNDEKYIIIGDPILSLNLPQDSILITSVNSVNPNENIVSLKGLEKVTINGEIKNRSGQLRSDFNGTALITLYDADRKVTFNETVITQSAIYYGGQLFKGNCEVKNGYFSITFRIPKDISFDTSNARIHAYAYSSNEDASGSTANIKVFGLDTTTITDLSGPEIKVFLDDRSFRNGDLVTEKPQVIVDLKDISGINSSGAGLGHNIEAWIDDKPTSIDLTPTYRASNIGFGEGTAQKQLINLEPGEHKIKVRAWDIYNNTTTTSTNFKISSENNGKLQVIDIVNFPNPAQNETDFLFRHNQTKPIDASIDVYTLSGRKIFTKSVDNITDRFVKIHWDLSDKDGIKLGNGVYLYKLRIKSENGDYFESIEKISIVK